MADNNEFDADDSGCDLCGIPWQSLGTDVSVSLNRWESDEFLDVGFCSWEHAAEWFARGEPEMNTWDDYPDPTRREIWFDRIENVLVPVLFLWACALMLLGAWTAANWIFPWNG